MQPNRLGRTLALAVAAMAIFNTLSAVSMPVRDRRLPLVATILIAALLVAHAGLYWFGDRVRIVFGLRAYVIAQAATVFAIGLYGAFPPVTLALYVALTSEVVTLAAQQWGTVFITLGAIALFTTSAIVTSDLYRGATAGLILAATGVIAHAIAGLVARRPAPVTVAGPPTPEVIAAPSSGNGHRPVDDAGLTVREHEVLRALARGIRTSEIAAQLAISERTVKAHLGSIYQKLGVESRTAAVAAAHQRGLLSG
jgi:DNA-binding CsgD family transcriptional regulator